VIWAQLVSLDASEGDGWMHRTPLVPHQLWPTAAGDLLFTAHGTCNGTLFVDACVEAPPRSARACR